MNKYTSLCSFVIKYYCIYLIYFHILMTGLGTGLAIASAFVALNTFFEKKRGQAVGFSMAGTTLAMMIVPQVRDMFVFNCYIFNYITFLIYFLYTIFYIT